MFTWDLVSTIFLGAVLRVAGATTDDFFTVFSEMNASGKDLAHPRIDALVVLITRWTYPTFHKFSVNRQR